MTENYIDSKDVCDKLKISKVTLWRMRKEGLPHYKLNSNTIRYNAKEIDDYLERERIKK